uniref:Zinc finger protein basonuclin-2 n=1 Tax=Salarias fasciatus TaxID=181472 RepID=A0A672F5G3_SALFA
GGVRRRSCDRCGHGWVAHGKECDQLEVEVALPGLVLDLSSLVLYGAQAIPVRLKILLDRLYSVLTPEQVGHILHSLGWTLGDYVRGYMLQVPVLEDPSGTERTLGFPCVVVVRFHGNGARSHRKHNIMTSSPFILYCEALGCSLLFSIC